MKFICENENDEALLDEIISAAKKCGCNVVMEYRRWDAAAVKIWAVEDVNDAISNNFDEESKRFNRLPEKQMADVTQQLMEHILASKTGEKHIREVYREIQNNIGIFLTFNDERVECQGNGGDLSDLRTNQYSRLRP